MPLTIKEQGAFKQMQADMKLLVRLPEDAHKSRVLLEKTLLEYEKRIAVIEKQHQATMDIIKNMAPVQKTEKVYVDDYKAKDDPRRKKSK